MNYEAIADSAAYLDVDAMLDLLATMRVNDPVAWVEPEGYRPFWAISKYDDIKFIETNTDKFIAAPRANLLKTEDEQIMLANTGTIHGLEALVHMDGEKHAKHRRITRDFFMPAKLETLQERIATTAKRYIDEMAGLGGDCDFASDIAFYYPLRVILSLIGLEESEDEKVLRLTQELFGNEDSEFNTDETGNEQHLLSVVQKISEYFLQVAEDRVANPRDDIATLLATAEIDGKPMGQLELLSYFVIAATAGHDTTSATTAGGLQALIENPEQLEKLKSDLSLLPSAVEEMIRWVCPVKHFMRTATEDVQLRDKLIKKGESVMVLFWSACRDEDVFENPNEFDIERKPNKHLAFGFGPHICLGQHLARREIIALFNELLPRLDEVSIVGKPEMLQSYFVSGLKKLPIKYTMR